MSGTSGAMMDRVSDLRKRSKDRESSALAVVLTQLPLWTERERGLPNALARSALFTAANRTIARSNYKQHKIAALRGIEIWYTGEELRQDDEDVFLQIVHLARQQPLGEIVEFSGYSLLKELGWPTSMASYKRLRDCINRLSATTLAVTVDRPLGGGAETGFGGSLIRKFAWESDAARGSSQRWKVWLEREIVYLFDNNTFTKIDWEQRLKLPPLAKWLHQFYFTHAEPFGMKVETIKTLCGSRIAVLSKFRYKLKEALDLLIEVGFIVSYQIDSRTDLLSVTRAPKRRNLVFDATRR